MARRIERTDPYVPTSKLPQPKVGDKQGRFTWDGKRWAVPEVPCPTVPPATTRWRNQHKSRK